MNIWSVIYTIIIKKFAWEDKTVIYFPYSTTRCEKCYSYTLIKYVELDTFMAKNRKNFRWFSLASTAMDKIVNVTKQ